MGEESGKIEVEMVDKEAKEEAFTVGSSFLSRNPMKYWGVILKKKLHLGEKKKKKDEPLFVPRVWGLGALKDFCIGVKMIFLGNPVTILCLIIPFALASKYVWDPVTTFVLCMLGIIPLAKLLGEATEELSLRTGQTIGGLLNATFRNAVELIISIVALKDGLLRVVQASLLGSILSNLLLVMGMSFFLGGIKYPSQKFNQTGAQTSSSLLTLAVMAILFPAAFFLSNATTPAKIDAALLSLSRVTAIVILIIYVSYLVFQLKTHSHLFVEAEKPVEEKKHKETKHHTKEEANDDKEDVKEDKEEAEDSDEEEEEEEHPRLAPWGAIVLLVIVTVIVAILAEFLVGAIESVVKQWGISETFVGIILLPIVGNAAEHVTAVSVAMKNKMDLSIGVAVGSSIQIALLVIPVLVILGWIIGQPLTLFFQAFETVALFVSVIIVNGCIADGESNWLEGGLLIATYIILATGFFFHD